MKTEQDIQELYQKFMESLKTLGLPITFEQAFLLQEMVVPVAKLKEIALENLEMALTSPISGGKNARVLEQLVEQFNKGYVVQIDVDNFKEANKEDYAYGDYVLKELYNFLSKNIRKENKDRSADVIHEHGDEFKILFHADNPGQVWLALDRLMKGFFEYTSKDESFIDGGHTFSAGVSLLYEKGKKPIELAYQEAEEALREAKSMDGKNKVVLYKPKPYKQLVLNFK